MLKHSLRVSQLPTILTTCSLLMPIVDAFRCLQSCQQFHSAATWLQDAADESATELSHEHDGNVLSDQACRNAWICDAAPASRSP